ncbi:flagellar basal body P-ring formation chaperone FlgA [Maritalea sp.]|uniref:flagellar basal body P-ring formation chaperone FlgA n=1 Tax=Maritalea sp. TaxID=2003361 RepID=UPI003EF3E3A2
MINQCKALFTGLVFAALSSTIVVAAPVLKPSIMVNTKIVTIGDMFEDAGRLAETGLFMSPAPGTVGAVPIASIKLAAQRAGLENFDTKGISHVRVERSGMPINIEFLSDLFGQEINILGLLGEDQEVVFSPYRGLEPVFADPSVATPITLLDFDYQPQTGVVSARLALAGHQQPLNINGKIEISAPAAHLRRTMARGEIVDINDIEFLSVPVRFSQAQGDLQLSELLGKSLTRSVRGGSLIRRSDLSEPVLIQRNDMVTILYRHGSLRLTVKGQALNSATENQVISVLNLMSKKTVQGIATGAGTVVISNDPTHIASR